MGWHLGIRCGEVRTEQRSKLEGGLLLYDKGNIPVAIAVVRGDVQGSLLADLHGSDTLIPALDDTADADLSAEVRLADGGVEPNEQNRLAHVARIASFTFLSGLWVGRTAGPCYLAWRCP